MMLEISGGWAVELERGPDWVFLKLTGDEPFDTQGIDVADRLWELIQPEFAHRVVIELDDLGLLRSHLIGELVRLQKRLHTSGGILRLSGLSSSNYDILRSSRLDERFPWYQTREEAVLGHRPGQPR